MNTHEIKKIIDEFGISMPKLASKIGISTSSFKKKIGYNYPRYKFSSNEIQRLEFELNNLVEKLEKV